MSSGELLKAAEDGDVSAVKELLEHISSKSEIDDEDDTGKTALMAAARGDGTGGEEYGVIIDLLVATYAKLGVSMASILGARGGRQKWNIFMHAAKCGHEGNLSKIFELYDSVPTINLEECVDWANVDHKVKKSVGNHIYGRTPIVVTNYGSQTRRTKRNSTAASAARTNQNNAPKKQKKAPRPAAKLPGTKSNSSRKSLAHEKKPKQTPVPTTQMDTAPSSQSLDEVQTPKISANVAIETKKLATASTSDNKEGAAEHPSKSIYDLLNEVPADILLEVVRKRNLIDMTSNEDAAHQPDGSGRGLQSLIRQNQRLAKVKTEKATAEESLAEAKDDAEDAQELAQQQTLAVDILHGRIDDIAKIAEDHGVDPHQINSVRHRSLASGK